MSGSRLPIILAAERDTVLTRALEALGRFPLEEPWVLIGGLAVFIRLGSITRPTADADTVALSQAGLIARLVNDEIATVVSGAEIEVPVGDGTIEVDVMDLADEPLPADSERRAFALARRGALASALTERVIVTDRTSSPVADVTISLAAVPALVGLKTVAMVRRPHSRHPEKVGSDIHDLVRLVTTRAYEASRRISLRSTRNSPCGSPRRSNELSARISDSRFSGSARTTGPQARRLFPTMKSRAR